MDDQPMTEMSLTDDESTARYHALCASERGSRQASPTTAGAADHPWFAVQHLVNGDCPTDDWSKHWAGMNTGTGGMASAS